MVVARLAGLPAALGRRSTNGCGINDHFLGRVAVDTRRYLSSSSDGKKPERTKAGTRSKNDAAPVGKATDTSPADTLSTKPTSPTKSDASKQSLFDRLSALYNENSGENELSLLKQHVATASRSFDNAVRTVLTARLDLEKATSTYDDVNKRHSSLLMRRDQWDADDATAFATLTAEEVQARKSLATAREALRRADDDVSSRQVDYIDAMRRRYHEEQIWQDRWRVLGTYGTWTLIGLNSLIFFGGQLFHYRREATRLKRIEDLIRESNADRSALKIGIQDVETVIVDDDKVGKEAGASENEMEQEVEKNEVGVQVVDATNATDVGTESTESVDGADSELLVYNDVTCPSDAESSDFMERLKKSRFAKRVRNVVVGISEKAHAKKSKSDSQDTKGDEETQDEHSNTVAIVSHALTATVEEVHWPSAAFGAAASAVGILLICSVAGRR